MKKPAKREGNEEAFSTWSGIPIKSVYTPNDVEDVDYDRDLNDPGKFPFTRGIHEEMYRRRTWSTKNLCGLESPLKTNERLKYLMKEGQTAIAIVPDTPTQLGVDADHPLVAPQVGTQGVPLYSLRDMEELFQGIELGAMTFSISVCSVAAPTILAQVSALARQRGVDPDKIRGSIQNDPIQARHCTYDINNPLDLCLRLSVDAIEYCVNEMPNWHSLTANAYDLRESGADSVMEMGLALANVIGYIELALQRKMDIDSFAHQMLIICSSHIDFFEQIAKIRATRKIWANLMKERFHAKNPRSMRLKIAVHTAGSSLTAQQPINNVIRSSFEALAAVLGGGQGLDLSCYDEALCTPTEESAMVALRTQQILIQETGVTHVADPLGGSYYVEYLTRKMEEGILELLRKVDAAGGIIEAVKNGWFRNLLDESAVKLYRDIDSGKRKVVGVNVHKIPPDQDNLLKIGKIHLEPGLEHIQRVRELKETRDSEKTKSALRKLYRVASDTKKNLMPSIVDAVSAYATMGEINGTLRLAYGKPYDPYEMIEPPFTIG
jgi:methylmalonyl-CoA mutase N-terminal domain/subunit